MSLQLQQSRSSRFRGLFDAALQNYEEMTNITLTKHPLAEKLHNCHSSKSIKLFFRDRALEFGDFPGSDKIVKSITNIASILCSLSATATLGDATDPVRSRRSWDHSIPDTYSTLPPAKAIQIGLAILIVVRALRCSCVRMLLTSKFIRLPSGLTPAMTNSSPCSNRSSNFSNPSTYMPRSLPHLPWKRWLSRSWQNYSLFSH